jgi:predicted ArsR family transcriptional regulator
MKKKRSDSADSAATKRRSAKTHWVTDGRQVEAIAHPARQEIVDRLVAAGPMSARELAASIGRNVTTLYHHLKNLEEVGLIEQMSSEALARGRPYVVYKPIAPRIRLIRASADPELRGPMSKWARVVGAQVAKEYIKGMVHPEARIDGQARNLYLGRAVIAPSSKRLKQINKLLNELSELMLTQDPTPGPMLSIGWFLAPLDRGIRKSTKGQPKLKKQTRS